MNHLISCERLSGGTGTDGSVSDYHSGLDTQVWTPTS